MVQRLETQDLKKSHRCAVQLRLSRPRPTSDLGDQVARATHLRPGGAARGAAGFAAAEIDDDAAIFDALDDAVDDVADAVLVFLVLAVAFGLAYVVQAWVVKPYRIPSESMVPTLKVFDVARSRIS